MGMIYISFRVVIIFEEERRRGVPLGGIQTVGAEHRSKAIEDKKAGERSGGQI